ncbi:MAG TPA: hypothetical protein VEI57_11580 [Nitrospirota bacterium]|nr:hypothetical protein [Nitrospirota bacterium]
MLNNLANQGGVSLIAAIFIIVILAFMGVMLLSMVTTSSLSSVNDLQSTKALYVAEGGVEYILGVNTFPNYSTNGATTNLGAGNFKIDTPATVTTAGGIPASGASTFTVNKSSWAGFPAPPGNIVIDSEIMTYSAWNGTNQFTVNAAGRGAGGTTAAAHAFGAAVYPATTTTAAVNNLPGTTTIPVSSTIGFVIPGVIQINNEFIWCENTSGNNFTNCIRAYKGSTIANHVINSNVFQYMLRSTGSVGNAGRAIQTGVTMNQPSIAFDQSFNNTVHANILTWNHTVSATATNSILFVGVSTATTTVSGPITYGTQNMSLVGAANNTGNSHVEIWRLIAPATGTHLITVNLPASVRVDGGSVSFTGVNQTTPIDAGPVSATGNNNAPSLSINTITNSAWVFDTLTFPGSGAVTATAAVGQTQMWSISHSAGGGGSYQGPISPAGSVTMSWTLSNNEQWVIEAVALRPAVSQSISQLFWNEIVN